VPARLLWSPGNPRPIEYSYLITSSIFIVKNEPAEPYRGAREGLRPSLLISLPLSWKERGIKGVRLQAS
jgi:hypothetical protein